MKYMTVQEASAKWGVSDRRVRFLCAQGRIRGIIQQGRRYLIPEETEKPRDERMKRHGSKKKGKYNDFSRIDFLKGMIADSSIENELYSSYDSQVFLEDFVCNTACLAKNTLSKSEVHNILEGSVAAGHTVQEHLEVVGLKDAWKYVVECIRDRKVLSQNIIRNIHGLLMIYDVHQKGKYRKVQITSYRNINNPIFLDLMEPRINDLLNTNAQRKKVMHPIERIARFHLEFMSLHPFQDGNGRAGRILLNYELLQNGYPPVNIRIDQKGEYEDAFKSYYDDKDVTCMVRLISKNLEESLVKQLDMSVMKKNKTVETVPKLVSKREFQRSNVSNQLEKLPLVTLNQSHSL